MLPFQEEIISDKIRIRKFEKNVDFDELTWHRDAKDRVVRVIESFGWYFQFDNELPVVLRPNDVLQIPAGKWHRVIRKDKCEKLIVEIIES